MNFRRATWGVGLLGALALPGCGGDDTPTPDGTQVGSSGSTGAGGNDASVASDTSTGKSGGSASDSGGDAVLCQRTAAIAITGQDLAMCKGGLAEAGAEGGGDAGGAGCFACLCTTCPLEAKTCIGNPNCKAINDCCRAACNCPSAAPEGGSDAPASEGGGNETSTTDSPAGDGSTE